MSFLHISARFLLNVSIGVYDMSILITARVLTLIESHIHMCDIGFKNTARVTWRKIDIMSKRDFDLIPKIDTILRTNEHFIDKIWTVYIVKSHMY